MLKWETIHTYRQGRTTQKHMSETKISDLTVAELKRSKRRATILSKSRTTKNIRREK